MSLEAIAFGLATEDDAGALALLRTLVAQQLTTKYGSGHWSAEVSPNAVLRTLITSRIAVARLGSRLVGTLRLATRKPWAIDPAYFTPVKRALYLTDMAVHPDLQGQGLGRRLLGTAADLARTWPGNAIRLDAYAGPAGAGGFYSRCAYRACGHVEYRGTALMYFEQLIEA
ncbi:MAG: GNAT family N-acetyltransferase [Gemmatimonadota bacterium]